MRIKGLFVVSYVLVIGLLTSGTTATIYPKRHHHRHHHKSDDHKKELFAQQMDSCIESRMSEDNAAGMSIVVVANNQIVYQKGFGYADKENSIPVDSSTVFHIGSITKLFTGIGIMQLAQKRMLNIDEPIQRYLPDFSIKYHVSTNRPITIRSIMAHQSGIFGDRLFHWATPEYPEDDYRTFPEFAADEYAAYVPNYVTAYSNFAVSLLGLIIERVSGESYEEYIKNNILLPCGMTESGFDPKNEFPSLLAQGYDNQGNEYPYYYVSCNPAGFLASNSDNMAKFIQMIINNGSYHHNRILHPYTLRYMYLPHSIYCPGNLPSRYMPGFGLSWVLSNWSWRYLGTVVWHNGTLPPYNSDLIIAPDKKVGVFVTANSNDFIPDDICSFALIKAAEVFKHCMRPDLPTVPPVTEMPDHIRTYVSGTYCTLGGDPIEIFEENDTLFFQQQTIRVPLVYHCDNWMSFSIGDTVLANQRISVRCVDNKKTVCIEGRTDYEILRMVFGNELKNDELLPDSVRTVCGIYSDVSTGTPAFMVRIDTLEHSGGELLEAISLSNGMVYVLKPGEQSTQIIQGFGRSAQETMRIMNDTLSYLGIITSKAAPLTRHIEPIASASGSHFKGGKADKKQIIAELRRILHHNKMMDSPSRTVLERISRY